jgi:hypothetical protein
MSARPAAAPAWRPLDLWRTVAGLAAVLGAAAALLAALDAVPSWIAGEARDVRRVPTVAEAERRLRTRLLLPGYFPDTIAWPPALIRVSAGDPGGASLTFEDRAGGTHMVLAETARPGRVPERLLPRVTVLNEVATWAGSERLALRRIVGPDGHVWREIAWLQKGRQVVLRSRGSVEEMLRMARTTRDEP